MLQFDDRAAHILSFGGGVNTVALMIMLVQDGAPLDAAVFADTGGEVPETYHAVDAAKEYLGKHGIPLVVVQARPRQTDLYQTATRRHVIPSVQWRWCTRDFKVRPIHKYYAKLGVPINQYLGIAFDEVHRMKDSRVDHIKNVYPLIDKRMTRKDCVDLIIEANLPVPEKAVATSVHSIPQTVGVTSCMNIRSFSTRPSRWKRIQSISQGNVLPTKCFENGTELLCASTVCS